ncbi:MAG TPA: hypothetical protein VGG06_11530 [Thermoanaerobaculia bacterium]
MLRSEVQPLIEEGLAPILGPTMARAAVEAHSSRLAIAGSEIDEAGLGELLTRLELGLKVFVGPDKSRSVMREIWSRIDGRRTAGNGS